MALAERIIGKIREMLQKGLQWGTGKEVVLIRSPQELLNALKKMSNEDIGVVMAQKREAIKMWVEENFPEQQRILVSLHKEELTPQQLHERLIKDLRE